VNVYLARDDYTLSDERYVVYQMNVHPWTGNVCKYIYAILT